MLIDHAPQFGTALCRLALAQAALGTVRRKPGRIAIDLQRSRQLQCPAKVGLDGDIPRAGTPERIALPMNVSRERRWRDPAAYTGLFEGLPSGCGGAGIEMLTQC